jgi:hypothetical protein
MPNIDLSTLDREMSAVAKDTILNLLNAWAWFESILTEWLVDETKMEPDTARIVFGRMDPKGKLDKLSELFKHKGVEEKAKIAGRIRREIELHSVVRNTVVHCPHIGVDPKAPTVLLYLAAKFVKGNAEAIAVHSVSIDEILTAAKFALAATEELTKIVIKARGLGADGRKTVRS